MSSSRRSTPSISIAPRRGHRAGTAASRAWFCRLRSGRRWRATSQPESSDRNLPAPASQLPDTQRSRCEIEFPAPACSAPRDSERKGSRRRHGLLQSKHRGGRRRRAIERPRQSSKRDHAGADRRARERDDVPERERPVAASAASAQNTTKFADKTSSRLHSTGCSRSRVACQWSSNNCRRREVKRSTVHRRVRTAAVPSRRADRPRADTRSRRAAAPREPLPYCGPSRRRFRAAANASRATHPRADRRPPRIRCEHDRRRSPPTISTSPDAMKSIEMDIGGPLMPRSKSRAMARSVVRRGSSRCPMPGGVTHALVN